MTGTIFAGDYGRAVPSEDRCRWEKSGWSHRAREVGQSPHSWLRSLIHLLILWAQTGLHRLIEVWTARGKNCIIKRVHAQAGLLLSLLPTKPDVIREHLFKEAVVSGGDRTASDDQYQGSAKPGDGSECPYKKAEVLFFPFPFSL